MLSFLRPCSLSRIVGVYAASRRLCSAEPTRAVLEKHRTPTQGQWPRVLSVRLPCSLRIGPVDAMDADAVSVSLVGSPESPLRPTLKLGREDDSLTLSMSGAESKDLDGLLCCVRLPAMLSVKVHLSGKAQATLENLVLDQCTVTTEDGDIALSSVKTNKAELCTLDGWIRSKSLLQGHLSLTSKGSGGLEAQRLVGTSLEVSTSSGDQTVAAAYVERATMVSTGGNLRLGTLHSCSAALKTSSGSVSLGGGGDCTESDRNTLCRGIGRRLLNVDRLWRHPRSGGEDSEPGRGHQHRGCRRAAVFPSPSVCGRRQCFLQLGCQHDSGRAVVGRRRPYCHPQPRRHREPRQARLGVVPQFGRPRFELTTHAGRAPVMETVLEHLPTNPPTLESKKNKTPNKVTHEHSFFAEPTSIPEVATPTKVCGTAP
ncbi:unnamed protein product [Ixodes pacificus]